LITVPMLQLCSQLQKQQRHTNKQ